MIIPSAQAQSQGQQPSSITFVQLSQKAATSSSQSRHNDSARSQTLHLGAAVGNLCTQILNHASLDPYRPPLPPTQLETLSFPPTLSTTDPFWSTPSPPRDQIYEAIGAVFWSLVLLANICQLDLRVSILKKIALNAKKYPVELCKGRSGKYTDYSDQTGITRDNQSTLEIDVDANGQGEASGDHAEEGEEQRNHGDASQFRNTDLAAAPSQTVQQIMALIQQFATDRNWSRYHLPRNLVLAMMGEMGELAELFQFCGDGPEYNEDEDGDGRIPYPLDGWTEEKIDDLQQELADVSIYCLRLADVVGISDLGLVAISTCTSSEEA